MEETGGVIQHLPTELLLNIFQNLEAPDLCRAAQTCKRFYEVIENYYDKFFEDKEPLVTNQMSPWMVERSHRLLEPLEKRIVLDNWENEHYQRRYFQDLEALHSPSLQLSRDYLWWTTGKDVKAYKRSANGNVDFSQPKRFEAFQHDIVKSFIVKDDLMLVGGSKGALWMYSLSQDRLVLAEEGYALGNGEICCMDWVKNLIVAGFPWGFFNFFTQQDHGFTLVPTTDDEALNFHSTMALCPDATSLAVGTFLYGHNYGVNIMDVASGLYKETVYIWGADRVTQLSWESPSMLWVSEKTGKLVRWDLRADKIVQKYKETHGSGISCFRYDHQNTVVTGTKGQGRVTLWDTRQNGRSIQVYNMGHSRDDGIESLDFDAEFLFGATNKHLCVLDFSPSGNSGLQ